MAYIQSVVPASAPMQVRRVALIGHSGAGKSACLLSLGIDHNAADMDAALGTKQCPTLALALDWLASDDGLPDLAVVSNHEQMLLQMQRAKLAGQHADLFSKVQLVYLHKPEDELRASRRPVYLGPLRPLPPALQQAR